MKLIDNHLEKLGDDLKGNVILNSKIRICASIFSMYGFEALKKELSNVSEFNFIFTDPTFVEQSISNKEQRIFEINSNNRKKSLGGSCFEVKLKNELNGKSIAKECADWIKKKARFKSNINDQAIQKFMTLENTNNIFAYTNMEEFSTIGLGYEKDDSIFMPIVKIDDYSVTKNYIDTFDQIWNDDKQLKEVTKEVIDFMSDLYKENPPEFIYYVTLYNIFTEFLEDISEDELANEKTGFKESKIWNLLYDFQKDAVLGIINKLERYNGCILADSVGLGKTYTALGVIKYYQERNKSILVLCPKKLSENWNTYIKNYKDNPLQEDRFNYDVFISYRFIKNTW